MRSGKKVVVDDGKTRRFAGFEVNPSLKKAFQGSDVLTAQSSKANNHFKFDDDEDVDVDEEEQDTIERDEEAAAEHADEMPVAWRPIRA